jgi:hypothetical protein
LHKSHSHLPGANSFSALSKLHSGLPERAVTDIVCYRSIAWAEHS